MYVCEDLFQEVDRPIKLDLNTKEIHTNEPRLAILGNIASPVKLTLAHNKWDYTYFVFVCQEMRLGLYNMWADSAGQITPKTSAV